MPEKIAGKPQESIESKESSESKELADQARASVDSSGAVADILEGVDLGSTKSESISSRRESKGDPQGRSGGQPLPPPPPPKARPLPSPNVMKAKVVEQMKEEEAQMVKDLPKLVKSPHLYAEKVRELRSLRQKISEFLRYSFDAIKEAYLKLFGKKHGVDSDN